MGTGISVDPICPVKRSAVDEIRIRVEGFEPLGSARLLATDVAGQQLTVPGVTSPPRLCTG